MTSHKIDLGYELLKSIKYLGDYKIDCVFESGETGVFDLTPYLGRGVFKRLEDLSFANSVHLVDGVLTWGDNEIDLAPERVYYELTGKLADHLEP